MNDRVAQSLAGTISESARPNRLGRFSLPFPDTAQQEELNREALAGCVVVRAEAHWANKTIEYTALSPAFAPVPEVCEIPRYVNVVTTATELMDGSVKRIFYWELAKDVGPLGTLAADASLCV